MLSTSSLTACRCLNIAPPVYIRSEVIAFHVPKGRTYPSIIYGHCESVMISVYSCLLSIMNMQLDTSGVSYVAPLFQELLFPYKEHPTNWCMSEIQNHFQTELYTNRGKKVHQYCTPLQMQGLSMLKKSITTWLQLFERITKMLVSYQGKYL